VIHTVTGQTCRARGRQHHDGEQGSGTVLVLVVIMLLFFAGGTVALTGAAIAVRHRAETAADLAALSGASALQRGTSSPCAVAGRVAVANGARLVECAINGALIDVAVALQPRGPLARLPPAHSKARAGPAL
jgi:secretion/DNA translocation related TadE-like protein